MKIRFFLTALMAMVTFSGYCDNDDTRFQPSECAAWHRILEETDFVELWCTLEAGNLSIIAKLYEINLKEYTETPETWQTSIDDFLICNEALMKVTITKHNLINSYIHPDSFDTYEEFEQIKLGLYHRLFLEYACKNLLIFLLESTPFLFPIDLDDTDIGLGYLLANAAASCKHATYQNYGQMTCLDQELFYGYVDYLICPSSEGRVPEFCLDSWLAITTALYQDSLSFIDPEGVTDFSVFYDKRLDPRFLITLGLNDIFITQTKHKELLESGGIDMLTITDYFTKQEN